MLLEIWGQLSVSQYDHHCFYHHFCYYYCIINYYKIETHSGMNMGHRERKCRALYYMPKLQKVLFELEKTIITFRTTCLVQWLACLTAIQEVPGSIPGYILETFLKVQGLERGVPSLVRTIGQLLDMRSSEIWLRKLKLRLRDKCFANHKAPCTVIWQQPLQSVLALWGCSATDLI